MGTISVATSPHFREDLNIRGVMYAVVAALAPAAAGAVYFFGTRALVLIAIAAGSAVAAEALCQAAGRRKVTAADGSALVTGILLAFTLPPGVPYWLPAVGSVFAVAVAKVPFGGLGYNLLNPALAARAFLAVSWPLEMASAWVAPARGTLSGTSGIDATTGATPLTALRITRGILGDPTSSARDLATATDNLGYLYSKGSLANHFFGNVGGSIGETSVLLIAIGAVYLFARRIISWRIPAAYLATVAFFTWAAGGEGWFHGNPVFQLVSGGLVLGAFFMATDIVTSPVTPAGRLIFGFGCGAITSMIRLKGAFPEGVAYAILIMNLTVPLLDRLTRPRILGEKRRFYWLGI
jgi:electron transport complex protein RnfD